MKLPDDTLYLPIKQVYFDAIVEGSKHREYREIKEGVTANRYLIRADNPSGYELDPGCTAPGRRYFIDDYNNGRFPFMPRQYKYLYLAVGYAKERDTCLVEVLDYTFEPKMIRYDRDGRPCFAFWLIVFHLGSVYDIHRAAK